MTETPLSSTPAEPGAADPQPNEPALAELLSLVTHPDAQTRLEAVHQLGRSKLGDRSALRALEKTAAQDNNRAVREAALEALAEPHYRALQQQANPQPLSLRQSLLTEISRWQADGLLSDHLARLLQQRYNFDLVKAEPAPAEVQPVEKPRLSLAQVLLSETTIKVALYLGAFFVVAAAFILAAIFDVLRLPILGLATVGFLGTALALRRRLPTASFVLFTVFSFLLPIDAAVFLSLFETDLEVPWPYWVAVSLGLAVVWAAGTFFYHSRLFSVLTLAAASLAMFLVGRWLERAPHLDLLLIELPTLAALGGVALLARWQGQRFSLPLFILAQLQQVALLAVSILLVVLNLIDQNLPHPNWWLVIACTWLLAVVFYVLSQRLTSFVLFPPLAVAALSPVPLLASGAFSPSWQGFMALAWVWGTVLALGGEGLGRTRWQGVSVYSLWLLIASAGLYLLAAVGGLADQAAFGVAYLSGAAIVYLGLTLSRPRAWLWSASLFAATAAYLAIFFLPSVAAYNFYPGFIFLWPALALLGFGLILRRRLQTRPLWYRPPLVLGTLTGALALLVLLTTGFDEPLRAMLALGIAAGFLAVFGWLDRQPLIGYGATASLALALGFGLVWQEAAQWLLPLVGLAALYYGAGLIGGRLGLSDRWAGMLRWSGLGLGTLAALTGPLQGGVGGVIGPALVATFFTIEAFRLRQVWWGAPANLLYLIAYFTLLVELDVSQPQFYSIGAALLGFVMHYFLVRSGSRWAAFLTGLLSQFILLGTSYIQMFSTEQIFYFFVLFVQALVVLIYGLVVRSRSLVLAPLLFVVLGVITVALSALAGIPALILVGCTGLLLLLLGIAALMMREKILAATNRLGERLGGWQA